MAPRPSAANILHEPRFVEKSEELPTRFQQGCQPASNLCSYQPPYTPLGLEPRLGAGKPLTQTLWWDHLNRHIQKPEDIRILRPSLFVSDRP